MAKGRHIHRRRRAAVLIALAIVAGVALLVFGGAAFAAIRYEHTHADRIMPGVSIAGIDVSGMTRAEAMDAVNATVAEQLSEPLTVTVDNDHWTVTPATLGRRAAVGAAVRKAFSAGGDLGTLDRAWHRMRGEALGIDVAVDYSTTGGEIEDFATMMARHMFAAPQDLIGPDDPATSCSSRQDGNELNVDVASAQRSAFPPERMSCGSTRGRSSRSDAATMGRTIVWPRPEPPVPRRVRRDPLPRWPRKRVTTTPSGGTSTIRRRTPWHNRRWFLGRRVSGQTPAGLATRPRGPSMPPG
jgi:hypothetical protein